MTAERSFTLREMTLADVEAGLRLCRLSHWNQVARDWEQFLRAERGGATVAVDAAAGQVIGSVAIMRSRAVARDQPVPVTQDTAPGAPIAGSLAWVAMVLVDPVWRGRGVGTALLHHGLAQISAEVTAGLDATPLGQPLYEKLGFEADATFTRMHRPNTGHDVVRAAANVRPATPADLGAICALDEHATGLDRRALLAWLYGGAPELAWVREGPLGLEGALLGRHGHTATHLGPILAVSPQVALGLVHTCLASHPDDRFLLDVADGLAGWRTGVEAMGFRAQRSFTRMYRGDWRPMGDATHRFASIGPEFG